MRIKSVEKTLVVFTSCLSFFLQASSLWAQQPAPGANGPATPYTPGLDITALDKSVDPCVDFYQYACGGWQKNHPIPPDQSSWAAYDQLYQENFAVLRGILERAASGKGERDALTTLIGDFYTACMDEKTLEKRGLAPIQQQLEEIARLKSTRELAPLVARLHVAYGRTFFGWPILFGGGSIQDPDDSEHQIAGLRQGGLGLPDRDYYIKEDAKSKETRERYLQHIQKVFGLLGDSPGAARGNAIAVMGLETALAKASLTQVERRDRNQLRNRMSVAELEKLAPNFGWQAYYKELRYPYFEVVNVGSLEFFKEVSVLLENVPLDQWKSYLRFHVADASADRLAARFVEENFDFYGKYLRGAKELEPRWKRCVQFTDSLLGDALGQAYVRQAFSPELKQSTRNMVQRVEAAMERRIHNLDWMSAETKEQALAKLHTIRNKIGYPDKWRDYSSVRISRSDFAGDMQRAVEFENRRDISKIGQPLDRGEWAETPPTVDAYYDPQRNDINFPAGVLQPPLYDAKMDDAPNYGDTGGTIGHELTHAFDDQGSQYDARGNLTNWWTKVDREKFEQRIQCIKDQYAQYVVVDDIHINSAFSVGEDVADLGGETLAYMAWQDATRGQDLRPVDGLTPAQRFFVGLAHEFCANTRPEEQRTLALTDPHSPDKYRVNGVVSNMAEFQQAFSCKAGQPMVRENRCRIW